MIVWIVIVRRIPLKYIHKTYWQMWHERNAVSKYLRITKWNMNGYTWSFLILCFSTNGFNIPPNLDMITVCEYMKVLENRLYGFAIKGISLQPL